MSRFVDEWIRPGGKKIGYFAALLVAVIVVSATFVVLALRSVGVQGRSAELSKLEAEFKKANRLELNLFKTKISGMGYRVRLAEMNSTEMLNCQCDSKWYAKQYATRGLNSGDDGVVIIFDAKEKFVVNLQILRPAD